MHLQLRLTRRQLAFGIAFDGLGQSSPLRRIGIPKPNAQHKRIAAARKALLTACCLWAKDMGKCSQMLYAMQ